MLRHTHPTSITRVEWILFASAFAAGAVDIIGFASLGGVFASAMTGNLALLAYHVAQGNTRSAIGSVIALLGFVLGCVIGFRLRRGRSERTTVNLLLGSEAGLLALFAIYCLSGLQTGVPTSRLQIVILAVAMGLQAVVGQMVSLSTIVFTTTLTRLVGSITDWISTADRSPPKDAGVQITLLASYLLGAVLAGVLVVHQQRADVLLPLAGVAVAFAAHRFFRERRQEPSSGA